MGSRKLCPSPRVVAVAEGDFEKGLLPHPETKRGGTLYTYIAKPFFSIYSSSLRVAVCKLPPTHSRVHEPLGHTRDKAREHQPKYTPGTVQPWGSLQASPVHKAMILFMGTHGAWMLHGSEFNGTFNPLLDTAAAVVVWLLQWPNVLNFFIFTIVGPCRCQAGI